MSGLERWENEALDIEGRNVFEGKTLKMAHVLLFTILLAVSSFIGWAAWAEINEVTKGDGKIVPSGRTQVIQHLEGGIIAEINVREGDIVNQDQVVMRIENIAAESQLQEKMQRQITLKAEQTRLQAEALGQDVMVMPEVMSEEEEKFFIAEETLFTQRQRNTVLQINILKDQLTQREQELAELKARIGQTKLSIKSGQEEIDILTPLVEEQLTTKLDLIRAQQRQLDLTARLEGMELSIPRTQTTIEEYQQRIAEKRSSIRSEAQDRLNRVNEKLSALVENIKASQDKSVRTLIRSPVRGTVNKILKNTIGGVVRSGEDLIEIVPLEDSLVVEAFIDPAKRASIWPGLPAVIKLSAYDHRIYGGLDAKIIDVSPDTIENKDKGSSFYRVILRTDKARLDEDRPIIPGMVATVDIITGKKTVLSYLVKPFLRAKDNALTEK